MHEDVIPSVDLEIVRDCLRAEGITTSTPLVTVPFTVDALTKAKSVADNHQWRDPFTANRIEMAHDIRVKREEGEDAWTSGFPGGFWSVVLDVAIVFDDIDINAEDYGRTYALGKAIHLAAHEVTHSAFASVSSRRFRKTGKSQVKVDDRFGISQAPETSTLSPGNGSVPEYNPTWIDEAFAQYGAVGVRERMFSESIPSKPRIMDFEAYGAYDIELPTKYLVVSEEHPDYPGPCTGVESIGFDLLTEKRPALVPNIKALITGKLAVEQFHDYLRNDVGSELYDAISERRPYTTWGNVLDQIDELS
jgi:hypothetical protein